MLQSPSSTEQTHVSSLLLRTLGPASSGGVDCLFVQRISSPGPSLVKPDLLKPISSA